MQQPILQTLNASLYKLGWSWQHPKIKAYLKIVAQRLGRLEFQNINEVPEEYLQRLATIVELYYDCNRLLELMKMTWSHPDIRKIVASYGHLDRMPIKGYKQLYDYLNDIWYNLYGF